MPQLASLYVYKIVQIAIFVSGGYRGTGNCKWIAKSEFAEVTWKLCY